MGGIWVSRGALISTTSETIGYKAGIALTREEFNDIMPKEYHSLWIGPDDIILRIRSEEYEELIAKLLYAVGNITSSDTAPITIAMFRKYRDKPQLLNLFNEITLQWINFLEKEMSTINVQAKNTINPIPFLNDIKGKYGLPGLKIATELLEGQNQQLHRSPWALQRTVEWKDTAELKSLFKSRSLETQYGTFFDQRFIDFLSQNFDRIDEIHWRKFEGLTCEFFERHGYYVEIGAGTNDDGVDARAWNQNPENGGPPTILIQCKRRQDKVDKTVIKALYADVLYENASKGLIVTTQSLTPGAEHVRTVRSYPIEKADRATLRKWIEVMRTPGTGIFMK